MAENSNPAEPAAGSGIEGLQFQQAEFEGPRCSACQAPLTGAYFQIEGHNVCPDCAERCRNDQVRPSHPALMKGLAYGFGAAIAGAILMGVISAVTGFQLALVAIAVGWMVGKAMRKGTGGLGGRRCQILAVL